LIVINVGRNTLVVLKEFLLSDLTIRFVITHSVRVSNFKGQQELLEDLLLSFLFGEEVWMLGNIIGILKIINVDDFATIFVKLIESLHNYSMSLLTHVASYSSDKLFKGKLSILINVELFEKKI